MGGDRSRRSVHPPALWALCAGPRVAMCELIADYISGRLTLGGAQLVGYAVQRAAPVAPAAAARPRRR